MIRIAILTDSFVGAKGGSEKHINDVISGLDTQKYHISVIQLFNGSEIKHRHNSSSNSINFYHFPTKRVYGLSGLNSLIKISQLLKKERIQITLSLHEMADILNAVTPANVIKLSSRRDMGFKRNKLLEFMIRRCNTAFKYILCPSLAVQEKVLNEGVAPSKSKLLYNGIDLALFDYPITREQKDEILKRLALPKKTLSLISIGNLNPWKGHKYLIDAIALLKQENIDCNLAIFGTGDAQHDLSEQVFNLALEDNVHLMGYNGNVKAVLPAFDIMVLPSLTEGLSNALLEASAAGLPIVATNVGGNPEVVRNHQNGLLVDAESPEQLAEAITALATDSRFYDQATKNSRQLAKDEFSIEKMLTNYDQLFLSLLEEVE